MSRRPVYALLGFAVETDHRFATPMARTDAEPDMEFVVGDAPWAVPDRDELATWSSARLLPSGRPVESVHRVDEDRTLYRFTEVLDFHLEPHRITAVIRDPAYAFMLEIRLLGPVLALVHELTGRPVLHGSAVVLPAGAIGFLAQNGGGKTTVAAGFVRRGTPLLSDDLLVLDRCGDEVRAVAGYPQMRMWPQTAEFFAGPVEGLDLVHPDLDKRRVPIGDGGLGQFHPHSEPVRVVYELHRSDDPSFAVTVRELKGAEQLMTLVRHCFLGVLVHGIGLGEARLTHLADRAEDISVRRVDYAGTLDDLDALCDRLAELNSP